MINSGIYSFTPRFSLTSIFKKKDYVLVFKTEEDELIVELTNQQVYKQGVIRTEHVYLGTTNSAPLSKLPTAVYLDKCTSHQEAVEKYPEYLI